MNGWAISNINNRTNVLVLRQKNTLFAFCVLHQSMTDMRLLAEILFTALNSRSFVCHPEREVAVSALAAPH